MQPQQIPFSRFCFNRTCTSGLLGRFTMQHGGMDVNLVVNVFLSENGWWACRRKTPVWALSTSALALDKVYFSYLAGKRRILPTFGKQKHLFIYPRIRLETIERYSKVNTARSHFRKEPESRAPKWRLSFKIMKLTTDDLSLSDVCLGQRTLKQESSVIGLSSAYQKGLQQQLGPCSPWRLCYTSVDIRESQLLTTPACRQNKARITICFRVRGDERDGNQYRWALVSSCGQWQGE